MGFEFDDSIDNFVDTVKAIKDVYPNETKKFMQKEGNKLKRQTLKVAGSSALHKITGNYEKGIKRGKPYTYGPTGAYSIRVYSSANHAHLIEDGHEIYVDAIQQGNIQENFIFFEEQQKNLRLHMKLIPKNLH